MNRADGEAALRARLTDEFLATLREAIKVIGWERDVTELAMFEANLHRLRGLEEPESTSVTVYDDD